MAVQETPIKKLTHSNAVDAGIVEHNGRFVIVNGKNGEIIENCNGWGYKTREKALKFLQANFDYKPKKAELIKDNVDSAVKEWKNGAIEVKQVIHSQKVTARQKPIHLANITKKYEFEDLALVKVKMKKGDRYIIVDRSNKVVDNCNGYGYRSKNKAIAYLNSLYKTTEKKGKHKKANKVFNTQLRSALSENQEEIDWSKVKLNAEQHKAIELIEKGENVFLTGSAGTGKSFLLKYIIHKFNDDYTRVCAPTGRAAVNVGGTTIHRLLHLKLSTDTINDHPTTMPKSLRGTHRVILDEVSMVRADIFKWLSESLRLAEKENKQPIQLIVVGDFYQLPPIVSTDYERQYFAGGKEYAFNSDEWASWHFKPVIFRNIVRQDNPDFIEALNKIRVGDASGIEFFNKNAATNEIDQAITLTSRNATAEKINREKLSQIKEPVHTFISESEGKISDSEKPVPDKIELKIGTQVVATANGENYNNGDIGIVTGFGNNGSVEVKFAPNRPAIHIKPKEWKVYDYLASDKGAYLKTMIGSYVQIPLKLGYAITIHKSQGQTYSRVNVQPAGWSNGLLYVSLSRCREVDSMYLSSYLSRNMVKTSPYVNDFYSSLEKLN